MKRIIKVLICCVLAVSMLTPMTATAAAKLATPTGFKVVTTTTSSVRVQWNKVKGAGKYTIQYGTNKNFKGAKKINVKGPAATVKNLGAKKVYYFRIRAIKKGRKASKYTKSISAKTVTKLNVDKKLKGTWRPTGSYISAGDEITELTFNGKGSVTVRVVGGGYEVDYKKTVKYKKSGTTAKFSAYGNKYSVKCYADTSLITVNETTKHGTYQELYTKKTTTNQSYDKFKKNFVGTDWYSPYFNSECKNKGHSFYSVQCDIDRYYDEDFDEYYEDFYAYINSSRNEEPGYIQMVKTNVAWLNVDIGNTHYWAVVEKVSSNKANAFIMKGNSKTYKKETWKLIQ